MQIVQRDAAAQKLQERLSSSATPDSAAPSDDLPSRIASLEAQFSSSGSASEGAPESQQEKVEPKPAKDAPGTAALGDKEPPLAAKVLGWITDRLPRPWGE